MDLATSHYNAWSQSILDVLFQPFWRWLVNFVPAKSTASSITAVGLLTSVVAASRTLYFTPTFTEDAPGWVFVLNAVCLFLYQTLDALDGKQSYRTQCCELEEFTDHGADSLSTIFMAMMLASAFKMGAAFPGLLIPLFGCSLAALYTTHAESYFTHSCVFEKFDVTEVQWVAIGMNIFTAVKGQDVWSSTLKTVEVADQKVHISLGLILICASGFGFINKTIANARIVLGVPTPLEVAGVRIPRRQKALQPYNLLIFLLTIFSINYLTYLTTPVDDRQPALFMLIHGLAVAKASCILVVQSMTRDKMPDFDICLLPPAMLFIQSYIQSVPEDASLFTLPLALPKASHMAIMAGLALLGHVSYVTKVCLDVSQARDVNVFSMKYGKTHVLDEGNYIAGTSPTGVPDAVRKWEKFKSDPKQKEAFNALYGVM